MKSEEKFLNTFFLFCIEIEIWTKIWNTFTLKSFEKTKQVFLKFFYSDLRFYNRTYGVIFRTCTERHSTRLYIPSDYPSIHNLYNKVIGNTYQRNILCLSYQLISNSWTIAQNIIGWGKTSFEWLNVWKYLSLFFSEIKSCLTLYI